MTNPPDARGASNERLKLPRLAGRSFGLSLSTGVSRVIARSPLPTRPRATEDPGSGTYHHQDPLTVADIYGILILSVLALLWRLDLASPPLDFFRISGA